MTMQFLKIGNKFIALNHIRAVAVSSTGQAVHVYLGESEFAVMKFHDEEAKALLSFLEVGALDLTPDTATQEE